MLVVATTCGNLLEVENAFCSKNLISRVLSHIALREHKSNKGKNLDRIIYMWRVMIPRCNEEDWHLLVFDCLTSQGILLSMRVHHLQTITVEGLQLKKKTVFGVTLAKGQIQ